MSVCASLAHTSFEMLDGYGPAGSGAMVVAVLTPLPVAVDDGVVEPQALPVPAMTAMATTTTTRPRTSREYQPGPRSPVQDHPSSATGRDEDRHQFHVLGHGEEVEAIEANGSSTRHRG